MPRIVNQIICALGVAVLGYIIDDYNYKKGQLSVTCKLADYAKEHPDETLKEFLEKAKENAEDKEA